MANEILGYSLALFGGKNSKLLHYAEAADKEGNNNGLIDSKDEENYFKQQVKSVFDYNFSFDNIKKAHKEHLDVWKNGHDLDYYDFKEISADYKTSLSKTLEWLNPGLEPARQNRDYVNVEAWKKNGITIANMSEKDYKESVEVIQSQIKEIEEKLLEIGSKLNINTEFYKAKLEE